MTTTRVTNGRKLIRKICCNLKREVFQRNTFITFIRLDLLESGASIILRTKDSQKRVISLGVRCTFSVIYRQNRVKRGNSTLKICDLSFADSTPAKSSFLIKCAMEFHATCAANKLVSWNFKQSVVIDDTKKNRGMNRDKVRYG